MSNLGLKARSVKFYHNIEQQLTANNCVEYDLAVKTINGLSGAVNWAVGYGILQVYSMQDAE
ncbi:hypothetical protein N7519_010835 [Penicillium mononematosum]|uniref:uncharacterized protein n=1 Tax=Penicillium mononematosum TaxID=268346 RepID=UPI0025480F92|nr:uncharacterized protein N7519_010835 [Penicillium mononematosum]KAJ6180374.1 hypothetical protein N7519_010835 [Penicillium mononematosum]